MRPFKRLNIILFHQFLDLPPTFWTYSMLFCFCFSRLSTCEQDQACGQTHLLVLTCRYKCKYMYLLHFLPHNHVYIKKMLSWMSISDTNRNTNTLKSTVLFKCFFVSFGGSPCGGWSRLDFPTAGAPYIKMMVHMYMYM